MDGIVQEPHGYPGTVYQAIRYEPLCGNLGTGGGKYAVPRDLSDACVPAMESFANNTERMLALYDLLGSRLENARVGGGYEVCMCFAMAQIIENGIQAAVCIWVDGMGRGSVYDWDWKGHWAGSYRPNLGRALPPCKNVDVNSLKAQWSSTAAQPTVSERVSTPNLPEAETATVVTTLERSVRATVTQTTIRTTMPSGKSVKRTS